MDTQNMVITGASRGVGAVAAERFAEQGHRVFAIARSEEQIAALAEKSELIEPIQLDISKAEAVREAFERIETDFGPISTLINNAGVVENIEFATQGVEMIDQIIDTNLKGSLYCTRFAIPGMIARKTGRIINVSSVAGVRGIPGQVSYCASKHGMNGFADALAQELIKHGVLVTSICPGAIDTPLWDPETNPYPGDLKGVMQPGEIVDLIEFILKQPPRTIFKKLVLFPSNEWH